jgi:hypothetical protein
MTTTRDLVPDDLFAAAAASRAALEPALHRDGGVRTRDLEWSCRTAGPAGKVATT